MTFVRYGNDATNRKILLTETAQDLQFATLCAIIRILYTHTFGNPISFHEASNIVLQGCSSGWSSGSLHSENINGQVDKFLQSLL